MDIEGIKDLIGWLIGILSVGIISVITGVISLIKASKLTPKELKSADLANESKELSIAEQLDLLATRAAEKTLKTEEKLTKTEERLERIETENKAMRNRMDEQDILIREQAATIVEQNKRLDIQDKKIRDQEDEIELLKCELANSKSYNEALIAQMKEKSIIPIEQATSVIKDCKKPKNNGRKTAKEGEQDG